MVVFALFIAFLYLYTAPFFHHIPSANELPRIYLTMAMLDRGAFDVGKEMSLYRPTPDLALYRGRYFSNKPPGSSIVALPSYWLIKTLSGQEKVDLQRLTYALRIGGAILPSLFFLCLIWFFLKDFLVNDALRNLVFFGYACGTMAFGYGVLLYAHQLAASFIGASFILLVWYQPLESRRKQWLIYLSGFLAGFAVVVDYQSAFIGPPLFIFLISKIWRLSWWRRIHGAVGYSIGAALPLGFLLFYHWTCFDDPLATGYQFLVNETFAQWHNQGFLGLETFSLMRWGQRHFSADDGLFYYSPFLILALPGALMMMKNRRHFRLGVFSFVVIVFFHFFIGSFVPVSGWDIGPRYVIVVLPFYLAPIAYLINKLRNNLFLLNVSVGLIITSSLIYLCVQLVIPFFPEVFKQPVFDFTWRFFRSGYVSYNLANLFDVYGISSTVPYLVAALFLMIWMVFALFKRQSRPFRGALISFFTVVLVLTSYKGALYFRRPIPPKTLNWLDRVWEPRHQGLKRASLFEPVTPHSRYLKPR